MTLVKISVYYILKVPQSASFHTTTELKKMFKSHTQRKTPFYCDFQSYKSVYFIYICLVINFYTAIMKIYLYFRLFQMFRQMLRICQGAQLSLSRVKLHPGRRTKTKELVNRILLSVSVVSFIFSFGFGSISG